MGIGEAIARRLRNEGGRLVLVAREENRGNALAAELGDETRFVAGSVTDPDTADAAVEAAAELGGVDVLINNAGMDFTGDLLELSEKDARRVFEINFFGALWMLLRVARELVERGGGSIINITSRLASIGVPTMAIYAASKGALLSLTRGAAVELAPAGIRINAVAPGLTSTALMDEWVSGQSDPNGFRESLAQGIPQRRFGTPEEVAAAVAYLAADESAHVTGASIPVDGGYTAA
jgi:NAD(P)-dependent dehydrogenase (short-subunit alcohol dehydrogenase family)